MSSIKKIFDKTNVSPEEYAKAYARMQLEFQEIMKEEDKILCETQNPDYEDMAVVDPWYADRKDLTTEEAYLEYGKDAVDQFIRDVQDAHTTLIAVYRKEGSLFDAYLLKIDGHYLIRCGGSDITCQSLADAENQIALW